MARSLTQAEAAALLAWHVEAGADEALSAQPVDWYAIGSRPAPSVQEPAMPIAAGTDPAAITSLADLRAALERFDGCSLRHTATNLVFADGNPDADLMFIGEAPGRDEDRAGLPFVGVSGRLLDVMLGHIGRDRSSAYITNILFWRPPDNRQPTASEIAACMPFVARHIELVRPKVLVFLGATSAKTLLGRQEGITRLRGQWLTYMTPSTATAVPCIATYHPAYLLRQPAQKRQSWRDFLSIKLKLDAMTA